MQWKVPKCIAACRRGRHTTNLLDILKADMKQREMNLRNINDLELLRSAAAEGKGKERLITALIICINNVLISAVETSLIIIIIIQVFVT